MASDRVVIIGFIFFWLAVVGDQLRMRYRRHYWAVPVLATAFGASGIIMGATLRLHTHDGNVALLGPRYPDVVGWVGTTLLCAGMALVALGIAGLCFREQLFRRQLNWRIRQWRREKRFNEWCDHLTPLEHRLLTANIRIVGLGRYMAVHGVERFGRWQLPELTPLDPEELRRIVNAQPSEENSMTRAEQLAAQMRRKLRGYAFGWFKS